ncbi:hypothetical protein Gotri_005582 [Gossypium trilobum]|uniref:Uncharacterized protein n=1 Tax=Gossypium trilobum TaxID=34281 RepID=A0A7J9EY00_9ROSI|nr:hypothetical protein [Gossypium trilobum]
MVNSSKFSIESAVDKATKKVCFIEDSMDGDEVMIVGGENKDSSTPKDDDDFKLLDGDIITGEEDGYMYKKKLVKAIGDRIGLVVRLDDNTDNSFQGRFTKMAVFLDLNKLFISKIKIEDKVQRIEYKSLPNATQDKYGLWMLVEHRKRKDSRNFETVKGERQPTNQHASRFNVLYDLRDDEAKILENHIPNPTNSGSGQQNGNVIYDNPLVEKESLPKQIEFVKGKKKNGSCPS